MSIIKNEVEILNQIMSFNNCSHFPTQTNTSSHKDQYPHEQAHISIHSMPYGQVQNQ